MPSPHRLLSVGDVASAIGGRCFHPGSPCLVGVELEWLTVADADPTAPVDPATLRSALAAAGPLPGASAITFEPGGQLELSTPPLRSAGRACEAAAADLAVVGRVAAGAPGGPIRLVGLGADPDRPPRRVVRSPRYDAMEAHFDAAGPAGRRMMCSTAAVQPNVGLGPTEADAARQWRLAHRLGPTLAAACANSPLLAGQPTGFSSARLATWEVVGPSRTAPVAVDGEGDGADTWARYAVGADVLLVRDERTGSPVPLGRQLGLAQWIEQGHEGRWPTWDDVDYHLTTLFPPIRPRCPALAAGRCSGGGWLELRMFDELPDPWWRVPVAVAAALLSDPEAGRAADRAATAAGAVGRWAEAARTGLASPALGAAARACFAIASDVLEANPHAADRALAVLVSAYAERWVDRGRCPADDVLDAWAAAHRRATPATVRAGAAEVGSWT
ncbi:MAG: glutamate-cysteine ligase family protein [Acidimicrobiales bacterium]